MNTSKKVITRLRGKTINVGCSEEDALQIVTPFVNLTAYLLSVTKTNEVPALSTLADSVKSAKLRLASLMANKLSRAVDIKNLSMISIDVIAFGGYFKISVTEIFETKTTRSLQSFIVKLKCETGATLISKLQALTDNKNLTSEESARAVVTKINLTGL